MEDDVEYMPRLCKDCQHLSGDMWCHAPQNGISLIDGSAVTKFAIISRNHDTQCGPNAGYWVQKVEQSKSWWKFWK